MLVFISYAREDIIYARRLYSAIKVSGLTPWMDKPPPPDEGLRPGERWRPALERVLRRADRVIFILSQTSVSKRGYVRNEWRLALDLMNSMPEEDILVIPIKKDHCEVPAMLVGQISLTDLHWESVPSARIGTFAAQLAQSFAEVPA